MGCQASKNQVCVAESSTSINNCSNTPNTLHSNNDLDLKVKEVSRDHSASSKNSKHSIDSGFSQCEAEIHIISEYSSSDIVKKIEDEFQTPQDVEFGIVGVKCSQRLSAKDKERLDEQRVLASLQKEGLVARNLAKTSTSVCFEVVASGPLPPLKPPPRLEKLKKRKKKKQKLTEEQINGKLLQAEERRKELERQRVERIQTLTNKSDVQNCLNEFEASQKRLEVYSKNKEEIAAERKQKKLLELQTKLQARKEHAELVRQRKMLNLDNELPTELNSHT